MQADSVISLVSATVAVAAAAVAVWQAREARRQAKAAEDQVVQARRSADASEEQVKLTQADRDKRDAPVFTCTPKGYAGSNCKILIRMESGPGEVTVRIPEIRVLLEQRDPEDTGSQLPGGNHQYPPVVPGGDFSVDVDLQAYGSPVSVELRLDCTELSEPGRSWILPTSVRVPGPRGFYVRRAQVRR